MYMDARNGSCVSFLFVTPCSHTGAILVPLWTLFSEYYSVFYWLKKIIWNNSLENNLLLNVCNNFSKSNPLKECLFDNFTFFCIFHNISLIWSERVKINFFYFLKYLYTTTDIIIVNSNWWKYCKLDFRHIIFRNILFILLRTQYCVCSYGLFIYLFSYFELKIN